MRQVVRVWFMQTPRQALFTLLIQHPAPPQLQKTTYILALASVADLHMQEQERSDIAVQEQAPARQTYAARIQRIHPLRTPILVIEAAVDFVLVRRAAPRHQLPLWVLFAGAATALLNKTGYC